MNTQEIIDKYILCLNEKQYTGILPEYLNEKCRNDLYNDIEYLIYSYLLGGIVSLIFFKILPSAVYRLKYEND